MAPASATGTRDQSRKLTGTVEDEFNESYLYHNGDMKWVDLAPSDRVDESKSQAQHSGGGTNFISCIMATMILRITE